jgi:hypothetical protein
MRFENRLTRGLDGHVIEGDEVLKNRPRPLGVPRDVRHAGDEGLP